MNIKLKNSEDIYATYDALHDAIHSSRFVAALARPNGLKTIKITKVRLDKAKAYCGNHAKACEGDPNRKHRRASFLEGADWVEFNDLVNDVLDEQDVEANVDTTVCILRKGRKRRVRYESSTFRGIRGLNGEWVWDKDGPDSHYEDYCGTTSAPRSWFPKGTPGIYSAIGYEVEG